MANSRIARFITEVAPPQYISVMRRRASKMLDTINEEDHRDVPASFSASSKLPATAAKLATRNSSGAADSQFFLREVQRSFVIFEN